MIVIARNPIDVLPSYANMINTNSHSLEVAEQFNVDFPDYWNSYVNHMVQSLKENHEIVVDQMARQIPTYFMRYEDLKMNPKPVLEELFCFLLDVDSIEGTVVQKRIEVVTSAGFQS